MISLDNCPPSFKDIQIAEAPSVYEAYLYIFTILSGEHKDKKYAGIHKGYVGDGYWNSSTDKTFNQLITLSNSNIRFEVIEYGDYDVMTVREHLLLKGVDARNNPMWFNKTNGAPKYPTPDLNKINELVERIEAGEFDVKDGDGEWLKHPVVDLFNMKRLQVRFEEDKELRKHIKESIDDMAGNTDECEPVTIIEARMNGEDVIGDGNHTTNGAYDSKAGRELKIRIIPEDVHNEYSNTELRMAMSLLNRPRGVKKTPITKADAIKQLIDMVAGGTPLKDPSIDAFLLSCKFSRNSIKTIKRDTQAEIDKNALAMGNQQWIDYTVKEHKKKLELAVERNRTSDSVCLYLSSAMFKWDNVFNLAYNSTDEGKKGERVLGQYKKLVVVVYHPNPQAKQNWATNVQPEVYGKMKYFLPPLGWQWEIVEMPTTMYNGLD
jgi:hypothetical protein